MKLFIQVKDGQPVNHPAFEENLIQAFGQVPNDWQQFNRVPCPEVGAYEVLDSEEPTYQKVDGVWQDVWALRPMTDAEKAVKQQAIKDAWAARPQATNWAAWVFNELTAQYEPPIPRPAPVAGKIVFWCGADNNWKEAPAYPTDGKRYMFDFFAWVWFEENV